LLLLWLCICICTPRPTPTDETAVEVELVPDGGDDGDVVADTVVEVAFAAEAETDRRLEVGLALPLLAPALLPFSYLWMSA